MSTLNVLSGSVQSTGSLYADAIADCFWAKWVRNVTGILLCPATDRRETWFFKKMYNLQKSSPFSRAVAM